MRRYAALLLLVPVLAASALVVVRGAREAEWRVLPDGTRVRISTPWILDRIGEPLGLPLGPGRVYPTEVLPPPPEADRAHADMDLLADAVTRYFFAEGHVPDRLAELEAPAPDGTPYVKKVPRDPWGNDYVYEPRPSIRTSPTFRLSCLAPDGSGPIAIQVSNPDGFPSKR